MRSNGLLKWLLIPVALLVLFVAIRLFSGGGASAVDDEAAQLSCVGAAPRAAAPVASGTWNCQMSDSPSLRPASSSR